MKFWEAMKALQEGKKVRCPDWEFGHYISSDGDQDGLHWQRSFDWTRFSTTNDWELYEEPVQTFSFAEVVKGLREGKKFRRKNWKDVICLFTFEKDLEGEQIDLDDLVGWENQSGEEMDFIFSIGDLLATDWIEVKEC